MLRYTIEATVIIIGILFSFYIEEIRTERENILIKNELLTDLNRALEKDLAQIEHVQEILNDSQKSITEIQQDIDKQHQVYSDLEVLERLVSINIAISFFPEDGIFTELISSGSFELIKNKELKSKLLEIYNHQKERNYSISDNIDDEGRLFNFAVYSNFRVSFDYNSFDGTFYGNQVLENYTFNQDYYFSNEFYGILSVSKLFAFMYNRLLNDTKNQYKSTLALSLAEISDK